MKELTLCAYISANLFVCNQSTEKLYRHALIPIHSYDVVF